MPKDGSSSTNVQPIAIPGAKVKDEYDEPMKCGQPSPDSPDSIISKAKDEKKKKKK